MKLSAYTCRRFLDLATDRGNHHKTSVLAEKKFKRHKATKKKKIGGGRGGGGGGGRRTTFSQFEIIIHDCGLKFTVAGFGRLSPGSRYSLSLLFA